MDPKYVPKPSSKGSEVCGAPAFKVFHYGLILG